MDIYNLVSLAGVFVLIGFAWLLSADKKNMNFRVILWGIALQILIALFIFVVPVGSKLFLQYEHGRDLFIPYLKYIIIIGKNQLLMGAGGNDGLSKTII